MKVTKTKLIDILSNAKNNGKFFGVTFEKRTTGEIRDMSCRFGVKNNLKGKGKTYDPAKLNLVCVWDMQKKGYRNIPLEGIRSIRLGGTNYEVK